VVTCGSFVCFFLKMGGRKLRYKGGPAWNTIPVAWWVWISGSGAEGGVVADCRGLEGRVVMVRWLGIRTVPPSRADLLVTTL